MAREIRHGRRQGRLRAGGASDRRPDGGRETVSAAGAALSGSPGRMTQRMVFMEKKLDELVLSMEHITKVYGNGFVANNDVTFQLRRGEIHGLVGENGAGKTTLMKVLFGHEKPEEGRILLNGEKVEIENPLQALDLGIGMVHQHYKLVDTLTVAENMVLGAEPKKGVFFHKRKAIQMTREISERYNLPIDPTAVIKDLSVGYKQRVEILKNLLRGAKILLLDEPTAVLTPQETEQLFSQLKFLKGEGFTIVFISHKLGEVKEICDRITVLRSGRVTGTADVKDISVDDIARMMVGRDVFLNIEKRPPAPHGPVLKVRDVSCVDKYGVLKLDKVSFDVRAGEILGVAGVEGNGQSELAELLTGLVPLQDGQIFVDGAPLRGKSIRGLRDLGVSMVHEDRMIYGVSSPQSIAENMISDRYYKCGYSSHGRLLLKKIKESANALIREFTIKCDGEFAPVSTLSGGNIQKVVAAREFSASPKLMIVSHPTRGIDIGATELIRKKIVALRDENDSAVLLFSADLTELLTVSDSIIVLYDGRIAAYFQNLEGVDEQVLGEYMLGIKMQSAQEIGGVIFD